MKFNTCDCEKDSQKCVYTGFDFLCDDSILTGDLYACGACGAINIFGIPSITDSNRVGASGQYLGCFGKANGHYFKTMPGGVIYLGAAAQERIAKYDSYVFRWRQ